MYFRWIFFKIYSSVFFIQANLWVPKIQPNDIILQLRFEFFITYVICQSILSIYLNLVLIKVCWPSIPAINQCFETTKPVNHDINNYQQFQYLIIFNNYNVGRICFTFSLQPKLLWLILYLTGRFRIFVAKSIISMHVCLNIELAIDVSDTDFVWVRLIVILQPQIRRWNRPCELFICYELFIVPCVAAQNWCFNIGKLHNCLDFLRVRF